MKKEYYKVVYFENGKYYSAWTHQTAKLNFLTVEYKLGEWVTPRMKYTSLFCFDDFYYAKRFQNRCWNYTSNIKIFKCEVGKTKKHSGDIPLILEWYRSISTRTFKERLRIWWRKEKLPNIKLGSFSLQNSMDGAVLTDKIKLISEV